MKEGKALMIQGTGSQVGKSMLVAAFCRIFAEDGYKVAPFKSQNMSLNSFVAKDGEMARIQVLQAMAACVEPTVDMNPILLKPKKIGKDTQLIIRGKPYCDVTVDDYWVHGKFVPLLTKVIEESLKRLKSEFDVIVIEGAGCPADIYIKVRFVNMKTAEMAEAPVFLVADISCARGGALASVVGVHELLDENSRNRIKGVIINKCEGNIDFLKPCFSIIEEKTGWPIVGAIPHIEGLVLPDEDSIGLMEKTVAHTGTNVEIAVIRLPLISNFTDFHPLEIEPNVKVNFVRSTRELGSPDAIVIPGTKNTIQDFLWLKQSGFAEKIVALARKGVPVIGVCGGFQMLGKELVDEKGIEGGSPMIIRGLGLIDISTKFDFYDKTTNQLEAEIIGSGGIFDQVRGQKVVGYEIHMGSSTLGEKANPIFKVVKRGDSRFERLDGASDQSGIIFGTYLHGLFDDPPLRRALVEFLSRKKQLKTNFHREGNIQKIWEESLERLAQIARANTDMKKVYELVGLSPTNYRSSPKSL
jgi:adenosylcobyric acid synthase